MFTSVIFESIGCIHQEQISLILIKDSRSKFNTNVVCMLELMLCPTIPISGNHLLPKLVVQGFVAKPCSSFKSRHTCARFCGQSLFSKGQVSIEVLARGEAMNCLIFWTILGFSGQCGDNFS